jgi:GDP-D-mannose 3', 5'-epimerase
VKLTDHTPTALVFGATGFIGHHLVRRLKSRGYWVRGVDRTFNKYALECNSFIRIDLRNPQMALGAFDYSTYPLRDRFDEIYQCAAEMGGMGYIHGGHDAKIMASSSLINLNVLEACRRYPWRVGRILFTSSACVYPNATMTSSRQGFREADAYPGAPDSEYGWEKLYAERLYQAYHVDHGIDTRVARLHNVYGPEGTWRGGREKLPAAMCRKVALAQDGGSIEVWGDGTARRSFLYIDDCVDALTSLMSSVPHSPLNVGSNHMVTVDEVALLVAEIAGKNVTLNHVAGPVGVVDRNSDNTLMREVLGWSPRITLKEGLGITYRWVVEQLKSEEVVDLQEVGA